MLTVALFHHFQVTLALLSGWKDGMGLAHGLLDGLMTLALTLGQWWLCPQVGRDILRLSGVPESKLVEYCRMELGTEDLHKFWIPPELLYVGNFAQ